MNRSTRDGLIQLLKGSVEKRKDSELEAILPVLKWRIDCLTKLDKDIIKELLRLAYYKKYTKHHVIIRQGKHSDKFYIIIQGSVSVFSNDTIQSSIRQEPENMYNDRKSRLSFSSSCPPISGKPANMVRVQQCVETNPNISDFGGHIETLVSLQGFGQIALLSGLSRDVTVVTNEDTEMMVIPHQTFLEKIKVNEEKEVEQEKMFIRTHPLFNKWPEVLQEQLQSVMEKHCHPFGATIVKQGSCVTGLHFLISDRPIQNIYVPPVQKDMRSMTKQTHVKRSDGYAAAEKLTFAKSIDICFVEEGEVCCDVELLLGLETNLLTMTACHPCEVYSLNVKSYEKLVHKKQPQTVNLMKISAENKLMGRMMTSQGKKIEILPHILYRLKYCLESTEGIVQNKDLGPATRFTTVTSKTINAVGDHCIPEEYDYVLNWYMRNKAPLLKPVTHRAVYYKEMMQRRAKARDELRKRCPQNIDGFDKSINRRVRAAIAASVQEGSKSEKKLQQIGKQ